MLSLEKRPRKFEDMVGHYHTITEMKISSKEDSFPQAMLFTGATGSGKTTLAFIISSIMVCDNPTTQPDGSKDPCLNCPKCLDIIEERFQMDVSIWDGGSIGKEQVDKIEQTAQMNPMYGKKRIIIIDEAQGMVSVGAKAKLLRMLEKPRQNVHFILMTMDEKKLITKDDNGKNGSAIIDRCSRYNFKRIDVSTIGKKLMDYLDEIDPEEELPESIGTVVTLIAENCHGSFRRALQDFQRVIKSQIYTEEQAIQELSYVDERKLYEALIDLALKRKDFFNQVKIFGTLQDFFKYSYATLVNTQVRSLTNDFSSDWQKAYSEKLIKSGNFSALLDIYNAMDYFVDHKFLSLLCQYYETQKPQRIKKVRVPKV